MSELAQRRDGRDVEGRHGLYVSAFSWGVGVFLGISACLKVAAGWGDSRIWNIPDPLFPVLTTRQMTLLACAVEIVVLTWMFLAKTAIGRLWPIMWVVAVFAIYRLGLVLVGYHGPCSCLGDLPASLAWAEWLAPGFLIVAGPMSVGLLLWTWRTTT